MSTVELKSSLHQLIDAINDSKTLKVVYSLLSKQAKQKTDGWDSLTKQQQKEIEEAIHSLEKGDGIPHEKVMAKYKGKYL